MATIEIKAPFIRTPFNYDMNKASDESALHCKDKSLTKQSFLEEVDINTIASRYGLTGQMPDDVRPITYGDFTNVFDFKSAMDAIATANESFDAMPAPLRSKFHNDPQEFVEFCSRPENLPEMRKMGLAIPEATPPAPPPAQTPPAAPEPATAPVQQ